MVCCYREYYRVPGPSFFCGAPVRTAGYAGGYAARSGSTLCALGAPCSSGAARHIGPLGSKPTRCRVEDRRYRSRKPSPYQCTSPMGKTRAGESTKGGTQQSGLQPALHTHLHTQPDLHTRPTLQTHPNLHTHTRLRQEQRLPSLLTRALPRLLPRPDLRLHAQPQPLPDGSLRPSKTKLASASLSRSWLWTPANHLGITNGLSKWVRPRRFLNNP